MRGTYIPDPSSNRYSGQGAGNEPWDDDGIYKYDECWTCKRLCEKGKIPSICWYCMGANMYIKEGEEDV